MTGVLAFVPAQRSDAQVYFSVGFGGPGYYGYYHMDTTIRTAIPTTNLTIATAGSGIIIVTTDITATIVGN